MLLCGAKPFPTQSREHANTLIVEAVKRAIQKAHDQSTPHDKAHDEAPAAAAVIHADERRKVALVDAFNKALLSKYGTAENPFKTLSKDGLVSKKEFKKVLVRVMPDLTLLESKGLRKQLPKKLGAFIKFVDPAAEVVEPELESAKKDQTSTGLADLPIYREVPEIPSSFLQRPHAQQQLLPALVDNHESRSTSITAPTSKIASQGST